MAQCVVHALKGLACRARVTQASSRPSPCMQAQRSRHLRSTRAAVPVLLAHANVTENINNLSRGPKLTYSTLCSLNKLTCVSMRENVCTMLSQHSNSKDTHTFDASFTLAMLADGSTASSSIKSGSYTNNTIVMKQAQIQQA